MSNRLTLLAVGVLGLAGLLVIAATAGGCANPSTDGGATAQAGGEKTVTVENDHCPVMGADLHTHTIPVSMTREYKGHQLGFCCSECLPKWDKMPDAQKDAALAKSVKPKT